MVKPSARKGSQRQMSRTQATPEEYAIVEKCIGETLAVAKLGQSALATTYEIEHPKYGTCALKMLSSQATKNKKLLDRFFRPLEKAKNIEHFSVAQIYEISSKENFWMLRELAAGQSLEQKVAKEDLLSIEKVNHIILQLASGLSALHDLGVVHKNLKPGNIILNSDDHIKIVDFSLPPTTPHYLSPEQCKGKKSDFHSDIYAIGVLYYFCLIGEPPFALGSHKEVMQAHISMDCPDIREKRDDLPDSLTDLLSKMLAKKPEERLPSCRELYTQLRTIAGLSDTENEQLEPQQSAEGIVISPSEKRERSPMEQTIQFINVKSIKSTVQKINKFKQIANDMVSKLRIFNQTLAMLENTVDNEDLLFLDEMLRFITQKTGELLGADRTIIFLLDEEQDEFLAILDQDEGTPALEMRIPPTSGIVGEVFSSKNTITIPHDFYAYPNSAERRAIDEKTNYRTYTMMALPVIDRQDKLIAVVQLLNKLKEVNDPQDPLQERIDMEGFTEDDEELFAEFSPSIRMILEASRSFYRATRRQKAFASLMSATASLNQGSIELEETLNRVMEEAKQLLDADRITLWLLDNEKDELWAQIEMSDGEIREIRIPKHAGFAGKVVQSGEPLLIPFDLYDHVDSETAKKTDRETKYRTCSMLCMPVFNASKELIGVTQLINKKRPGNFAPYDPSQWPAVPDCWKASFNKGDEGFMKSFNIQAGVALQNAKMFDLIKRQEKMQRDMLRSLSNGVISTDRLGKVIAANDSAKRLLGVDKSLRGHNICDLIHIREGQFATWINDALEPKHPKQREQYYPEQTLLSGDSNEHNINLSINSITDAKNPDDVYGALVVMEDISHEKRVKNMMYRYMTQEVVEKLLDSGDIQLGGERKEVSVLFSDIRGYTTLTEGMKAEEVVAMLNEYFEEMVDVIFKHKGTLDKYIGDAIMAVFGSPLDLEDHSWWAVKTAVEMRYRLLQFNGKRMVAGKTPLKIGIGIHTDEVICGNIGSSRRMEMTSIGDGVNLASRLEGASKQYGCEIVISENTYQSCADRIHARELDVIIVKGKTAPVKIYEVIGLRAVPIDPNKVKIIEHYHRGRQLYSATLFSEAINEFDEVLRLAPDNRAAQLHIKRCHHFLKEKPPHDWDGVWKMTSK